VHPTLLIPPELAYLPIKKLMGEVISTYE